MINKIYNHITHYDKCLMSDWQERYNNKFELRLYIKVASSSFPSQALLGNLVGYASEDDEVNIYHTSVLFNAVESLKEDKAAGDLEAITDTDISFLEKLLKECDDNNADGIRLL